MSAFAIRSSRLVMLATSSLSPPCHSLRSSTDSSCFPTRAQSRAVRYNLRCRSSAGSESRPSQTADWTRALNMLSCESSALFVESRYLFATLKSIGSACDALSRSCWSGARTCAGTPAKRKLSCNRSISWRCERCILEMTCSIVSACRLTERRMSTTHSFPSTCSRRTSRAERGAKRISRSCGYCESHERSAPRSIMPICISRRMALFSVPAPA
mmetsp:Transcript_9797/g.28406  ORF Transcript_9797/g.28406 Transcript_9797/m.28406 type:complete len:214 (+) Transcript_9797:3273-3914(+)